MQSSNSTEQTTRPEPSANDNTSANLSIDSVKTDNPSIQPRAPPMTGEISLSQKECNLSGIPSFTVFVDWKLKGDRTIYILAHLNCSGCIGFIGRLKDEHGDKKGLTGDGVEGSGGDEAWIPEWESSYGFNIEDPALLCMRPGDSFRQSYTFTVEERKTLTHYYTPNTKNMIAGQEYTLDRRGLRCRWVYEDTLLNPENLPDDKLRALLKKMPDVTTDHLAPVKFKAVGKHPEKRGIRKYSIVGYQYIPAGLVPAM